MVILGLGSNLEDRLQQLRAALLQLKQMPAIQIKQVSPVYRSDALLPPNAPATWNHPYLNAAIACETTLSPQELLRHIKQIENKLGRTPDKEWGPRIIDIDILAWDNLVQFDDHLHVPHEHLHVRPFALWPLADIAPHWIYPLPGPFQGKTAIEIATQQWSSRFDGSAPLHTKQIPHRIDIPQLVGILNATPDSFSDGGQFLNPSSALERIRLLKEQGAEIIDLGAESTGPSAKALSQKEEWQRLAPILDLMIAERSTGMVPFKISIDTRHPETAARVLECGADWINDVSGLENNRMREIVAAQPCHIVFMHHVGIPVSQAILPRNSNYLEQIARWLEKRLNTLAQYPISVERLIFDPGIGYGKTAEQSLELIKHIDQFKSFGVRILVGHSRKSFLQQFTTLPPAQRDIETLIFSLHLAKTVDYLRVHEVEWHMRSFKVAATIDHV